MGAANRSTPGRRSFMRSMAGTVAIGAAALGLPLSSSEAEAYDPGENETKSRYRVSDHVKAFYRTNGYETLKK